ncbi:MAG: crossover junction endodeoxyribonuclease RuvC [Vulcanimicrobiaceae bacterium]
MRILGIDPGLRITGYGAIAIDGERARLIEAGILVPDERAPLERRLGTLYAEARALIGTLEPEIVVIEQLWSSYRHPATAVLMGHARGVLCLAAHEGGVAVRDLGHALVKRALTGSGAARKEQVKRMVMLRLGLQVAPQPDDVSDALALALAFANVESGRRRLARAGIA